MQSQGNVLYTMKAISIVRSNGILLMPQFPYRHCIFGVETMATRIFMPHYITHSYPRSVIYRRRVIRVRVGEFTDILRERASIWEIINSVNGDIAIKAGIYPDTHAPSPRKAIGNLRFIGHVVGSLVRRLYLLRVSIVPFFLRYPSLTLFYSRFGLRFLHSLLPNGEYAKRRVASNI